MAAALCEAPPDAALEGWLPVAGAVDGLEAVLLHAAAANSATNASGPRRLRLAVVTRWILLGCEGARLSAHADPGDIWGPDPTATPSPEAVNAWFVIG